MLQAILLRRSMVVAVALLMAASFGSAVGPALSQEATPAAKAGIVAEPSQELLKSLADCSDVAALAPAAAIPAPAGATGYVIDSNESEARYVAQEELARIGANTAIGRTNAFVGQLFLDEAGLPVACSRFDVDMRTLVSDESRRDNFLYNNTLESEKYPVATYVVRGIAGLDAAPEQGKDVTFFLVGDSTLHGVKQVAVWEVTAVFEDGKVTGAAFTEFNMDDFNMSPPIVGPVMSVSDPIRLEVDIIANKQES